MKRIDWRKALLAGGAVLGAAATFNALAGRRVPPLENLIGGEPGWFSWRGRRIFYTRRPARGAGEAPPLLLVHSIHAAASSYEWRSNVAALAAPADGPPRSVYTIDLLGFGMSDRPDVRYSARLYLRLIDDFARQVVGRPCLLIASSLSGAYAIVLGAKDPGQFPALVLVEPTGLVRLNQPPGTGGDVTRLMLDAPVIGSTAFNALVSRRSLRYYLERVYIDRELVTDELADAYFITAHQPGARHAPAAFLAGHLNIDVRRAVRRLTQPVLLVWGEQAVETPVEDVRGFRALKPDLKLAILDPAGMLPHDEQAEQFNTLVREFITELEGVTTRPGV